MLIRSANIYLWALFGTLNTLLLKPCGSFCAAPKPLSWSAETSLGGLILDGAYLVEYFSSYLSVCFRRGKEIREVWPAVLWASWQFYSDRVWRSDRKEVHETEHNPKKTPKNTIRGENKREKGDRVGLLGASIEMLSVPDWASELTLISRRAEKRQMRRKRRKEKQDKENDEKTNYLKKLEGAYILMRNKMSSSFVQRERWKLFSQEKEQIWAKFGKKRTEKKKKIEKKTENWMADNPSNNRGDQRERWMEDRGGWDCDEDEEDWTDWKTWEGGGRKRRMSDRGTTEWWMKWRDNRDRGSGITLHLLSEKQGNKGAEVNRERDRNRQMGFHLVFILSVWSYRDLFFYCRHPFRWLHL